MTNKMKTLLAAAAVLVLVCAGLLVWRGEDGGRAPEATDESAAPALTEGSVEEGDDVAGADDEGVADETADGGEGDEESAGDVDGDDGEGQDEEDEEEKLVDEFDALTDEFRDPVESAKKISMEQIGKFREKFARVPSGRKEECLQRALNLVPDENVMLLAGILMDKSQPQEFLELVFNDILNRDETAKQAVLEQLYTDKEHPCWADAAWILDVTGTTPASDGAPSGADGADDAGGSAPEDE